MNAEDIQKIREIQLLRRAVEQAEALCATLDLCEFVEPIDFEADIDACRAKRALAKRLEFAESALFREHMNAVNHHRNGVKTLTA